MSYYTLFNVGVNSYVVSDEHLIPLYEGNRNDCLWFIHSKKIDRVVFTNKVISRRVLAGLLAISEVETKGRAVGAGDNGWVVLVNIDGKYYVQDQPFADLHEAAVYFIASLTDELRMIP